MSADPRRVQSLLGQVIRNRELRDRLEADPEAVLRELELPAADRELLLQASIPRLLAYHDMANNRLFRTVRTFIGGAATRLGEARLRADMRQWLIETGPHTPYLRDVPDEFLAWARPRWEADSALAPWIPELAAHQVMIRTLRNAPLRVAPASETKIDLERAITCNATARLLRYRWAVHRLPAKLPPDLEPKPLGGGHAVLGFRDLEGRPRFVDLEPRAALLVERLLAGQTLREALFGACEALGEALDDAILSATALTLADLSERHILLGGV